MILKDFLLVGLGGMLGSMVRYACNLWLKTSIFPFATLLVNAGGSFIMGMVMGFLWQQQAGNNNWKLFIATGICGGFTTFSAFAWENLQLLQNGQYGYFVFNVAGSIVIGLSMVWLGYWLGLKLA